MWYLFVSGKFPSNFRPSLTLSNKSQPIHISLCMVCVLCLCAVCYLCCVCGLSVCCVLQVNFNLISVRVSPYPPPPHPTSHSTLHLTTIIYSGAILFKELCNTKTLSSSLSEMRAGYQPVDQVPYCPTINILVSIVGALNMGEI